MRRLPNSLMKLQIFWKLKEIIPSGSGLIGARRIVFVTSENPWQAWLREDGKAALMDFSGIGEGIARVIGEYLNTGQSSLFNRLQGEVSPVRLFVMVPGIGETLARRIMHELDIESGVLQLPVVSDGKLTGLLRHRDLDK